MDFEGYREDFLTNGFDDLVFIADLDQDQVSEMCEIIGIRPGHRAKLRRQLIELRALLNGGGNTIGGPHHAVPGGHSRFFGAHGAGPVAQGQLSAYL